MRTLEYKNGNLVYRDSTPEEDAQMEAFSEEQKQADIQSEISSLKTELSSSDYKAIKYAEGLISEEDYAPIKAERQALRDRINELEEQLNQP